MFRDSDAYGSLAAPDLDAARKFYGETLGLEITDEMGGALIAIHHSGDHRSIVYVKPDHQPANNTVLNFVVDDLEAAVDLLAERGVQIERYEGFDQDEKGIARGEGGPPIAWFKDPAGNVLGVHEKV